MLYVCAHACVSVCVLVCNCPVIDNSSLFVELEVEVETHALSHNDMNDTQTQTVHTVMLASLVR